MMFDISSYIRHIGYSLVSVCSHNENGYIFYILKNETKQIYLLQQILTTKKELTKRVYLNNLYFNLAPAGAHNYTAHGLLSFFAPVMYFTLRGSSYTILKIPDGFSCEPLHVYVRRCNNNKRKLERAFKMLLNDLKVCCRRLHRKRFMLCDIDQRNIFIQKNNKSGQLRLCFVKLTNSSFIYNDELMVRYANFRRHLRHTGVISHGSSFFFPIISAHSYTRMTRSGVQLLGARKTGAEFILLSVELLRIFKSIQLSSCCQDASRELYGRSYFQIRKRIKFSGNCPVFEIVAGLEFEEDREEILF